MINNFEVYKCEHCGNIIEVVHGGGADIVCCGEPMKLQSENTTDAATEKHVPVVEKTENGFKVTIGSVEHPMTEEHYIEWIELIANNKRYFKFLKPGDTPEAVFDIDATEADARAYCNLHGLWKGM